LLSFFYLCKSASEWPNLTSAKELYSHRRRSRDSLQTVEMAYAFALPLRIIQAFFAFLVLILDAVVVHNWSWAPQTSPSEANFILFCAVWTLLAVAFLVFTPMFAPTAAHKFGILALEVLTTIFWFAGFIAFGSLLGEVRHCDYWHTCRIGIAAEVFAAFEW
jgi:Membrane-associating domain